MDISDPNRFFVNEEWENLPGWERCELQQSGGKKHAIDKRIAETRNKKRKTSAVVVTTGNQYMVASIIKVFMNLQRAHNEAVISSVNPHMNVSNLGANR